MIAPIVTWLASAESAGVTGQVFEASGQVLAIAEGWHRGPRVAPVEDPTALAPIVAGSQPYCIGYQPKCLPQSKMSVGVLYSVLCHDIAPFHHADVHDHTLEVLDKETAYGH